MNQFAVKNKNFPTKDIYKPTNIGRSFISIDMKKANFSSLRYYDASIFDNADTWEDFISKFTDNEFIINSKSIREVIMGNCNSGRVTTYEKFITDQLLTLIIDAGIEPNNIVFFSNDEIVVDVTDLDITTTTATYDISVGGSSVKSGSLTTSSATYTANNLKHTRKNACPRVKIQGGHAVFSCEILRNYQIATRSAGARYMLSPSVMP